ncbi:hypothetical protein KDN24_07730 [Bacillus sp. Bva_UNVM-123]|uniref:hypothetical protein n=1 Tax=Bacillus sp. Bva_UNVM-123 TaxID=2829798 RepID=UPI00391EEDAA
MDYITFAVVSLLILVPVVSFLPIRISIKGKLSLIGIALLIANVGLLSRGILGLWQSYLILLLLIILCSFILERRFGAVLLPKTHSETDSKIENHVAAFSEMNEDIQINNNAELVSPIQNETIILAKENQALENINESIENIHDEDELVDFKDDFLDVEIHDNYSNSENFEDIEETQVEMEETEDDVPVIESIKGEPLSEIDEDVSFLMNREEAFNREDSIETDLLEENSETAYAVSYMSEIEKILEETGIKNESETGYTQTENEVEIEELVFHK